MNIVNAKEQIKVGLSNNSFPLWAYWSWSQFACWNNSFPVVNTLCEFLEVDQIPTNKLASINFFPLWIRELIEFAHLSYVNMGA